MIQVNDIRDRTLHCKIAYGRYNVYAKVILDSTCKTNIDRARGIYSARAWVDIDIGIAVATGLTLNRKRAATVHCKTTARVSINFKNTASIIGCYTPHRNYSPG